MARIAMAFAACAVAGAARAEGDPPRYRFEVGQEVVYVTTSECRTRTLFGQETQRRSAETRLRVLRKNADSSFRLCVRHTETQEDEEPEIEFGWCDLHPDGRCVLGPTVGLSFEPSAIFLPLPGGDAREWEARGGRGERLRMRIGADGALEASVENGRLTVGGATCTARSVLSPEGLPKRIETVWSRGASAGRTTTTVLTESKLGDASEAATLDRELASYAEALETWTLERLRAPDEASFRAAVRRGAKRVRALFKESKSPALREELGRWPAADDEVEEAYAAEWRWGTPWVGKPAPDWTLEDLEGRRHALKDYRGKVVVLDFWYAECGPCLLAMPALKEFSSRHRDRVHVLGMNKDAAPEPARQVAAAMEIDYPTLRARDVVGKYGVVAFPTVFVLDREGLVRRVLVGCSPALGVELEAIVAELLLEPGER